ncbi:MAG TPA: tetratricopeptide repeat protein [Pyrinomonadaceae bacterium]|nr:tetratricopeptide repeat protein [Pyrinomonadaceae bacterium]
MLLELSRTFISNCILSSVATSLVLLFACTAARAQKTTEINSGMIGNEQIQGHIFYPPGDKSSTRPMVKLQSLSSPEITGVADQDGNFRFTHLRPDLYTVIVDGGETFERATDTVEIGTSGPVPAQGNPGQYAVPFVYHVQIYLKPKRSSTSAVSSEAFVNVPGPARDLYQQAIESARTGDHVKAIAQLKAAIAQAPKFALAFSELAAQYAKTGQGTQAVETLRDGLKTNPDDFKLRLNYGIALLNEKKFDAAESELRVALKKHNADSSTASYYLGLALMGQQEIDAAQTEFLRVIKGGGDKTALAHRYLGGIYWRNKQYRAAADELDKYLTLEPNVSDADKIRNTIKELRHKS